MQRYGVEALWWLRSEPHCTAQRRKAYRDRPAPRKEERHATVEVRVDEAALTSAGRRLGGRVYGTHQPREHLSLEQAVLA